jgi:hypothetical protein
VRPGRVVGTIIGWDDSPAAQYTIKGVTTARGVELDTGPICENVATGSAAPGIRLNAFAHALPYQGVYSICAGDFRGHLADRGQKLATLLGRASSRSFDVARKAVVVVGRSSSSCR